MDLYFIVGELTFPGGVAEQWRAADLPPTAKRRQPTTLDAVLASAEGPVRLEVRDDTVSLRVYLIDSAYFMVKDELAASLEVARKLGARGEWYSGDHVAGAARRAAPLPQACGLAHVERRERVDRRGCSTRGGRDGGRIRVEEAPEEAHEKDSTKGCHETWSNHRVGREVTSSTW
jgi:hypothetical protein